MISVIVLIMIAALLVVVVWSMYSVHRLYTRSMSKFTHLPVRIMRMYPGIAEAIYARKEKKIIDKMKTIYDSGESAEEYIGLAIKLEELRIERINFRLGMDI